MKFNRAVVATAGAVVIVNTLFVGSAEAATGPFTSAIYSCGSKYVGGQTTGYTSIWVNAAGEYSSGSFAYPGGTVVWVGDNSGTVKSYASSNITQWGFTGCTLK